MKNLISLHASERQVAVIIDGAAMKMRYFKI
jgi:hypothetical protein